MFYQIRHQRLGVLPFANPVEPTEAEALAIVKAVDRDDAVHPKTGKPYWAKVLRVHDNGTVETAWGLCDGAKVSAEHVDSEAAGYCPIREGEIVPARETMTIGPGDVGSIDAIGITGTGRVG